MRMWPAAGAALQTCRVTITLALWRPCAPLAMIGASRPSAPGRIWNPRRPGRSPLCATSGTWNEGWRNEYERYFSLFPGRAPGALRRDPRAGLLRNPRHSGAVARPRDDRQAAGGPGAIGRSAARALPRGARR